MKEFIIFRKYLVAKLQLFLRKSFLFSLPNFMRFQLRDSWFLLVPFCLAQWFQARVRVQRVYGSLFCIMFHRMMPRIWSTWTNSVRLIHLSLFWHLQLQSHVDNSFTTHENWLQWFVWNIPCLNNWIERTGLRPCKCE